MGKISVIFPVQILIQKLKAIAMIESSNLDLDDKDIFKPPQSVFLGGMTKGTLGNDNAMSIHFDFLPFLLLINKYNHELEISRFLSQSHDFSKCNSRFRLALEVGRSVTCKYLSKRNVIIIIIRVANLAYLCNVATLIL